MQRELEEKETLLKSLKEIDAADSEAKRRKLLEENSDLFFSQEINDSLETSMQAPENKNANNDNESK